MNSSGLVLAPGWGEAAFCGHEIASSFAAGRNGGRVERAIG
jgi:hypothetical protein